MAVLNELIHQPVRLRIMAALASLEGEGGDTEVDFTFLRDHLKLTDGNLGAHLMKLESAGYITVRKTFVKRKPRTFVKLSRPGQHAFQDHVDAIRHIVGVEYPNRSSRW